MLRSIIRNIVLENLQKADKAIFSLEHMRPEDRELVLSVTNGDVYTFKVAELLSQYLAYSRNNAKLANESSDRYKDSLQNFYNHLKSYDKNVFGLDSFDLNQPSDDIYELSDFMRKRSTAVARFMKLPSIVRRNLKHIPQKKYNVSYHYQMGSVADKIKSLNIDITRLQQLGFDDMKVDRILKKVFNSNTVGISFEEYSEKIQNLIDSDTQEFTREEITEKANAINAPILDQGEDFMVVAVEDSQELKHMSCNNFWCVQNYVAFDDHTTVLERMYMIFQFSEDTPLHEKIILYTESDSMTAMEFEEVIEDVRNHGMPNMEHYNIKNHPAENYPYDLPKVEADIKKQAEEFLSYHSEDGVVAEGYEPTKIMQDGQQVGEMDIYIYPEKKMMTLSAIKVDPDHRGNGYGQEAMENLIKKADELGFTISLTPSDDWGSSVPKLKRWYKSLGFIENKGQNKDFTIRDSMYRLPSLSEDNPIIPMDQMPQGDYVRLTNVQW